MFIIHFRQKFFVVLVRVCVCNSCLLRYKLSDKVDNEIFLNGERTMCLQVATVYLHMETSFFLNFLFRLSISDSQESLMTVKVVVTPWVTHDGGAIYSLDVSPNGRKLATSGNASLPILIRNHSLPVSSVSHGRGGGG